MASRAPKHVNDDFAPPWLKIPDQDNLKPGGPKTDNRHRSPRGPRDEYFYRYHGDYYGNGLPPRQRSFDYEDQRGFPPHGPKSRHHSVDDDYYSNGYYEAPPYPSEKCGPYHSQPSLYRDKHQNGRYPVNYPPAYYDGYMYDCYPDYHSRNKRHQHGENYKSGDAKDLQEEEFPSLNGEGAENKKARSSNSVWDGRPKINNTTAKNSNNVYKVLVPNKGGVTTKTGKKTVESNPTKLNGPNDPLSMRKQESTKEGSPSPPIKILKAQPRTVNGKKSHFLKDLKTNHDAEEAFEAQQTNGHSEPEDGSNGVESHDLDDDADKILSSSLEAEQRLLREMGWTEEEAEEECILTEDEKRDMEKLSEQLKQLKGKDQCNGHQKRSLKAFSPQHSHTYSLPSQESDDDSGSDLDL